MQRESAENLAPVRVIDAQFLETSWFGSRQMTQHLRSQGHVILTDAGIKVSMDGKGRWIDNVFIEGLWQLLKYECVYL